MRIIILVSAMLLSSGAWAAGYDFDWKNTNDMRGAWMMCATTGFTQGECPKVFTKCWQPPHIYKKKKKIKTRCTGSPSFSSTEADGEAAINEAGNRVGFLQE